MVVLLAGGAGYIGSHTAVELLNAGHDVVIVDDYSNSCPESIKRVEEITGKSIVSYEADVKDKEAMTKIFAENKIDCVIHFAGLKAVGESTRLPAKYYRNNIDTTLTLLECMKEAGVKKIVFSSSATVYGEQKPPYVETMPRGACSNPYGWTKAMMEQILTDCANADSELTVILLRYFNPIGAHKSGLLGESPNDIPNNLMPYIVKVANRELDHLSVFGNDYDTVDGTGVRDYIHVTDLADAHILALDKMRADGKSNIYNLGNGNGFSVKEVVDITRKVTGVDIKAELGERRPGDPAILVASSEKAKKELNWKPKYNDLGTIIETAWKWHKENPNGFSE